MTNRRKFLIGAGLLVWPGHLLARERVVQMQDCGLPDSEACKLEREAFNNRAQVRLAKAKSLKTLRQREVKDILAAHPAWEHSAVMKKGGKKHLISGGPFDSNYNRTHLYLKLVPLTDINGKRPAHVKARLYRKTGLGKTKTVAHFTDSVYHNAKERRSFRVNRFSADCVLLWSKTEIKVGSRLPPGCYPKGANCS